MMMKNRKWTTPEFFVSFWSSHSSSEFLSSFVCSTRHFEKAIKSFLQLTLICRGILLGTMAMLLICACKFCSSILAAGSVVVGPQNLLGPALDHFANLRVPNYAHDCSFHSSVQRWLRQWNRIGDCGCNGVTERIRGQFHHNWQKRLLDCSRWDKPGPQMHNLPVTQGGRIQRHFGRILDASRRRTKGKDEPLGALVGNIYELVFLFVGIAQQIYIPLVFDARNRHVVKGKIFSNVILVLRKMLVQKFLDEGSLRIQVLVHSVDHIAGKKSNQIVTGTCHEEIPIVPSGKRRQPPFLIVIAAAAVLAGFGWWCSAHGCVAV